MELIIAIMFFALSGAVCVRLFAGAHKMAEDDKNLNQAVLWTQNLAEVFYSCNGSIQSIKGMYPSAIITLEESKDSGAIVLFFDDKWEEADSSSANASYEAIMQIYTKKANEAYFDANKYYVDFKGNSIIGDISVIDLRGLEEVFSLIPEDDSNIIYSVSVDSYNPE